MYRKGKIEIVSLHLTLSPSGFQQPLAPKATRIGNKVTLYHPINFCAGVPGWREKSSVYTQASLAHVPQGPAEVRTLSEKGPAGWVDLGLFLPRLLLAMVRDWCLSPGVRSSLSGAWGVGLMQLPTAFG